MEIGGEKKRKCRVFTDDHMAEFYCLKCKEIQCFEIDKIRLINRRYYAYGICPIQGCDMTACIIIKKSDYEEIKNNEDED